MSFSDARETGLSGPDLSGVAGRAVASPPDVDYSDAPEALPARGCDTWTRAALDAFLRSPEGLVPGRTIFVGMPDPKERAGVIAEFAQAPRGTGE